MTHGPRARPRRLLGAHASSRCMAPLAARRAPASAASFTRHLARLRRVCPRARPRTSSCATARAPARSSKLDTLTEIELENARLRRLLDFRETARRRASSPRASSAATRRPRPDAGHRPRRERRRHEGRARCSRRRASSARSSSPARTPRACSCSPTTTAASTRSCSARRARGIVQGTAGGRLPAEVREADRRRAGRRPVVTSGLDGIFPKGLPIGEIATIDKRGQGLFQDAEVRAARRRSDLEEVLVTRGPVTPAEPPELLERPPA